MTCQAKRHGTETAYVVDKCRCPEARAARCRGQKLARYEKLHNNPRRVDAIGSRRRVHALMRLGHNGATIAAAAGIPSADSMLQSISNRWVNRGTAARIRAAYDQLSMALGSSNKTRGRAIARGWLPPIAWDDDTIDDPNAQPMLEQHVDVDEVAVRRALSGDRPESMRRAEILEAIRLGHQQGLDDVTLGERLGMATNAVQHIRKRNGITKVA